MHTHVVHSVNLYIPYKIIPTSLAGIFFNIAIAHLLSCVHQHSALYVLIASTSLSDANNIRSTIYGIVTLTHAPAANVSYSYADRASQLLDLHRKTASLASRKQRVVAIGTQQSPFGFCTPLFVFVISSNVIYLVFVTLCLQLLFSGATVI